MSFDSLLTHTVHIERDADSGAEDDYGHAVTVPETGEDFMAAIQPRTAQEMALVTGSGAPASDHTIFMRPRLLSEADKIVHDSSDCAMPDGADFGDVIFEIKGIRNAVGLGHHLEVDAHLVGASPGVAGS